MGLEIERKFLFDPTKLPGCMKPTRIVQGYLSWDADRTVRIRVTDQSAFITVKGKTSDNGLSRYEWEQEIDLIDGLEMLKMCVGVIDKTRYHMIHRGKLWELDYFHDRNEGLYVAEIELSSEDEKFDIPEWVIKEVTGDDRYYNSNLASNPYIWWLDKHLE